GLGVDRAVEGRDDAGGDGGPTGQGQGVADGDHVVAHLQGGGPAQLHRRQVADALDLDDGDVGVRIGAQQRGRVALVVGGQHDLDVGGAVDHVVVGEHDAVGADD